MGLAAVLFVALAVLVGCGGSDSSSTDAVTAQSDETLSKAEFVERADAICADWAPEREALQERVEELIQGINERRVGRPQIQGIRSVRLGQQARRRGESEGRRDGAELWSSGLRRRGE